MEALNTFALNKTRFTPDIATLELSPYQLLFVCDDLMHAGPRNHFLGKSERKGRGYTARHYSFYRKNTDGTPVVMKVAKQPENRFDFSALKIKGEIFQVRSEQFTKIDTLYQNGVQYRRERVKILYPTTPHGMLVNKTTDGKPLPLALQGPKHFLLPERVDLIECWMYIGTPRYWNDLLDGGFLFEPVRISEPKEPKNWLVKYYHYQNRP